MPPEIIYLGEDIVIPHLKHGTRANEKIHAMNIQIIAQRSSEKLFDQKVPEK
jgi:hypothetical protein